MAVIIDGTTGIDTIEPTIVPAALNASGSAPLYAARAWVNFNGTGTVAIRASGNVSSITDNGVGLYTVNFTNALTDANYSVAGWATNATGGALITMSYTNGGTNLTTTACKVGAGYGTTLADLDTVCYVFFR